MKANMQLKALVDGMTTGIVPQATIAISHYCFPTNYLPKLASPGMVVCFGSTAGLLGWLRPTSQGADPHSIKRGKTP